MRAGQQPDPGTTYVCQTHLSLVLTRETRAAEAERRSRETLEAHLSSPGNARRLLKQGA